MAIQTSTPYTDDADDREGRVAIVSTPETWFKEDTTASPGGADETVPYEDEIAHTADGDFVVLTRDPETNQVVPKSASRDLRKKIEDYEKKNVFQNAEAFVFNSALNTLYFDSDRKTVKISSDRVFSTSYKYWAICGVSAKDGEPVFYTGIESENVDGTSSVKSNLINTSVVNDKGGVPVGVTCTGHLVANLTHGANYRVVFYDADMIQIDQAIYQAYNVRAMTFDVNPESSIVDVQIGATGIANDTLTLEQGQPWSKLALRVYLKYANGETKDITSEWATNGASTGRVNISGLDDIDSTTVTPDDADGQKIKVTYYLASTNVDNAMVDPDTLSISHTYKVRIVANSEESIDQVIPSVWIEGSTSANARVCMKIFGINKDSNGKTYFVDNTYRLRDKTNSDGFIDQNSISVINNDNPDKIYFKFNAEIATEQSFTHVIDIPYGTLAKTKKYAFKTRGIWSNVYSEYTDPIQSDNVNLSGDFKPEHILKAKLLNSTDGTTRLVFEKDSAHTTTENDKYITYLKETYSNSINGKNVQPTHIRIRNGKDPTYWHSLMIELNSNIFTQGIICSQPEVGHLAYLGPKTPLIVEFIAKSTDEATLNVEKNVTKLALYFVDAVTA